MSEIISVIGLILATVTGAFGMNFWKVLEEWQTSPTKMTLWKSYGLCFVCVVLQPRDLTLEAFLRRGRSIFFPGLHPENSSGMAYGRLLFLLHYFVVPLLLS